MAFAPHVLPVFEQLGMLQELEAMSYICPGQKELNEKMELIGELYMTGQREM